MKKIEVIDEHNPQHKSGSVISALASTVVVLCASFVTSVYSGKTFQYITLPGFQQSVS
jgi:hypothetical protein